MSTIAESVETISGPAAWYGRDLRLWLALHEGRPIPDDLGRGGNKGNGGRGGIPAVPDRAEPLAGTYV